MTADSRSVPQTGQTVLLRLNHVVIAVRDIERAASDWERCLGAEPHHFAEGSPLRMKRCQIDVGDSFFALCEPLDDLSVFWNFTRRRGEGIFALSFDVADFDGVVERLRSVGTSFTRDERSIWIHPRHTHGVNLGLHREAAQRCEEASRFKGFEYIVVAVRDCDAAARDWELSVGLSGSKFLDLPDRGMRRMQFDVSTGMWVALVQPLGEHSYVQTFLGDHAEGVYMIAVKVDNPKETAREMHARGARILGDLEGDGPFYVHPHTTHGVLLGLSA